MYENVLSQIKISNQTCLKRILYKLTDGYGGVNTVVSVTSADSLGFEISREYECKQKYPRIKVGRKLRYQYDT